MIVWLLVLLLLIGFVYVIYQLHFTPAEEEEIEDEAHYTFKI